LLVLFGDPGWIRTTNLPLRRGLLYPVEPQSHIKNIKYICLFFKANILRIS
jgi:hypothetical protein